MAMTTATTEWRRRGEAGCLPACYPPNPWPMRSRLSAGQRFTATAQGYWPRRNRHVLSQIQRRRHVGQLNIDVDLAGIDLRPGTFVMHHHGGKRDHHADGNHLDDDERHRSPIDLPRRHPCHLLAGYTVGVR